MTTPTASTQYGRVRPKIKENGILEAGYPFRWHCHCTSQATPNPEQFLCTL